LISFARAIMKQRRREALTNCKRFKPPLLVKAVTQFPERGISVSYSSRFLEKA
jgi:hypothetical protein